MTFGSRRDIDALRDDYIARMGALQPALTGSHALLLRLADLAGTLSLQARRQDAMIVGSGPLDDLAQALRAWSAEPAAQSTQRMLRDTGLALDDLSRIRIFFRFLATITAVQAARLDSDDLSGFLGDLQALPRRIEAELAQVRGNLADLSRSFTAAVETAGSGGVETGQSAAALGRAAVTLESLRQATVEGRLTVLRQATRVTDQSRAALGDLVRALQFSDAAAQRLDHVAAILGDGAGDRDSATLAGAQLVALGDDAADVVGQLDAAFRRIGTLGDALVAELTDQKTRTSTLLTGQDRAAEAAARELAATAPVLQAVLQHCEGFDRHIDRIRSGLSSLEDIGNAVGMAAVNAYIKASRAETARSELAFIAVSVRENAARAMEAITAACATLDRLGATIFAPEYAAMREAIKAAAAWPARVEVAFRAERARHAADSGTEKELQSCTADLARHGASGLEGMGALRLLARMTTRIGRDLQRMGGGASDPTRLSRFEPLYTMAREREVHARVTGTGRPVEVLTLDLDAVLF